MGVIMLPSHGNSSREARSLLIAVAIVSCFLVWYILPDGLPNVHVSSSFSAKDILTTLDIRQKSKQKVLPPDHQSDQDIEYVSDQPSCRALAHNSNALPDFVRIPIEAAVSEDSLIGWEDQWLAYGDYNVESWGRLEEPKLDFIYLWVNGSDEKFQALKDPYQIASPLNDAKGAWRTTHGVNRYRDWDELRYSLRSLSKHTGTFLNKVQILVNGDAGVNSWKQTPDWLNPATDAVEVLTQGDYFEEEKAGCLPTFNSLTMENQMFNTPSDVDRFLALSDDMLLGKGHAASDIYSPLFGPVMSFKPNSWNLRAPPTPDISQRFGEKPYLLYTSWLLNQRFGERKRKGQAHFGHSLSRKVMREALSSFPRPEINSALRRFRGEPGFQIYSWFATYHYVIERHREALLWSYLMLRSDTDGNGDLSWTERQKVMQELAEGMQNEGKATYRKRNFYSIAQKLHEVGIEPPQVNTNAVWTSLDGPSAIQDLQCADFDVDTCLAPGFSTMKPGTTSKNPIFSTNAIFDRISRQDTKCGDCLLKIILHRTRQGLDPLLPHANTQAKAREMVVKALMRYQYTIAEPEGRFMMVRDAEQVENLLVEPMLRAKDSAQNQVGQLCLNDDVVTKDEQELKDLKTTMKVLYEGLLPEKSRWEK